MTTSKYGDLGVIAKILEGHDRLTAARAIRIAAEIVGSYDKSDVGWTPENVELRLERFAKKIEEEGIPDD